MRIAYHEALEGTRLDVVRLGALVGDAIRVAVDALNGRDAAAGLEWSPATTSSTTCAVASRRTASS